MKAGGDLAAAAASPAGLPGRTRDRSRGRCPPGPVTGCPISEHNLRRVALESPPTRVVLKTGNSHFVGASRVVTLTAAEAARRLRVLGPDAVRSHHAGRFR